MKPTIGNLKKLIKDIPNSTKIFEEDWDGSFLVIDDLKEWFEIKSRLLNKKRNPKTDIAIFKHKGKVQFDKDNPQS